MFMKRVSAILALLAVVVALSAAPAQASIVTYGFQSVTNTTASNAAIGEAQLFVDVSDVGADVLFTFYNVGPEDSSIADVYFDDGALLGIAFIDNTDAGVTFSQDATPHNLPGGGSFTTTAGFSADSDTPIQLNGVNPGETLGVLFELQSGKTFADVINDLSTDALRVGIHVQSFENGGSESFVNSSVIPEPASVAIWSLLGLTWAGLSVWRRRRGSMVDRGVQVTHGPWSEENRVAIRAMIARGRR